MAKQMRALDVEKNESEIASAMSRGIRAVIGMLQSEKSTERAIGAIALGRMGKKNGVEALETAMKKEEDGSVAIVMGAALDKLKLAVGRFENRIISPPKGEIAGKKPVARHLARI